MDRLRKGRKGEKIVANYLLDKNYQIVRCNYYTRWGEVDIIAWDVKNNELVFVEVKTRTSRKYGYAEEAVDEFKLRKIMASAEDYLAKVNYNQNYRFDCLVVELNYFTKKAKLRHYKNIGY